MALWAETILDLDAETITARQVVEVIPGLTIPAAEEFLLGMVERGLLEPSRSGTDRPRTEPEFMVGRYSRVAGARVWRVGAERFRSVESRGPTTGGVAPPPPQYDVPVGDVHPVDLDNVSACGQRMASIEEEWLPTMAPTCQLCRDRIDGR